MWGINDVFVGRIFIDPKFFRQGYGMKLMMEIEDLFHSKAFIMKKEPRRALRVRRELYEAKKL